MERIFDNRKFNNLFCDNNIVKNKSDFIFLNLTKDIALTAIQITHNTKPFTNNLRDRPPILQFDCAFRGKMTELGIRQLLQNNGISYKISDKTNNTGDTDIIILGSGENLTVEVKSSLLPTSEEVNDSNKLLTSYQDRDIKILCNNKENPYDDISKDIYIQTYFQAARTERDNRLISLENEFESIQNQNFNDINVLRDMYNLLNVDQVLNNFIVGWTTDFMEIQYLESLNNKNCGLCWSIHSNPTKYSKERLFWKCPLNKSYKPKLLIPYLQSWGLYAPNHSNKNFTD